jgi:hypothetical protein
MSSDVTPSGAHTSPVAPSPPPGAVPVYGVAAPGTEHLRKVDYIVVFGHANLFYWWPVWLVCFILAALTYLDGSQMAVLSNGTQAASGVRVEGFDGARDVLVAPASQNFPLAPQEGQRLPAGMTVSRSNTPGVVFVFTLLVVAIASTILLRGLVSLVAIVVMIATVVTLALFNVWNDVLFFVGGLDIRINAAGYLCIGIPLFVAWFLVFAFYDRAHFVVFDQGQIRYVLEVGDSEVVVQSEGAVVEKKRNDVFRHWLFGFGSGDLVIHTGGQKGQSIELENVLNINRKLVYIDRMLKEKAITVEG